MIFLMHILRLYTYFPELVSVPYPNQTLENDFSKISQQKSKEKLNSDRARLTLYEYIFNFNFYRRNFEKFVFIV